MSMYLKSVPDIQLSPKEPELSIGALCGADAQQQGLPDAHPEAIQAVVDGTARAVAFINADPVTAGTETVAVTGASAALETGMFRKMEWRLRLDEQTLKSPGITAEFLHGIGKLKKVPDLEARARPQFVQRAVGSH